MSRKSRKERVRIGSDIREVEIPRDAYWGPETALALENFPISGYPVPKAFIRAIVLIKKAAAKASGELGAIPQHIADAIMKAADEALEGKFDTEFVVDVFNSGAGTSLHMNVNEVLANRAAEILGGKRGDHTVDPHNHLNHGQSTNDVIPTAIRIACVGEGVPLVRSLSRLRVTLRDKGNEFWQVKTAGRTHTIDALPIRLGHRFLSYSDRLGAAIANFEDTLTPLYMLGIGGSAVGTGANTVPGYRRALISALNTFCVLRNPVKSFREHHNLFAAMSGMGPFVSVAGALDALAIELSVIGRDLELSASGPKCGIGEIMLPSVQPGSSAMPGKVNPTMAENLDLVLSVVLGNNEAVRVAASRTQWELNTRMPVIGWKLLESFTILTSAVNVFTEKCVKGITANTDRCRTYYENTASWFTLLNHSIGYDKAAELQVEVLKQVEKSGETILKALIRIAKERNIKTTKGEEITESVLEHLAFPYW